MRAMLEPILGETGALVAQFAITLAVVLLLLLVVVWLVRRYSRGGIAGGSRGRLPRLAIVDAMAVDNRRKLVLVRRDNVEHLILIGGPSDLVVEPGIIRQRAAAGQRQAAAQQAVAAQQAAAQQAAAAQVPAVPPAAATPAEPLEPEPGPAPRPTASAAAAAPPPSATARARLEALGSDQPIPFPPRRSPLTARGWLRRDSARQGGERVEPEEPRTPRPLSATAAGELEGSRAPRPLSASARFEEIARPTAIQPSFSLVGSNAEDEPELPAPLDFEEPEAIATDGLAAAPAETAAEFAVAESADESAGPAEAQPVEAVAPPAPGRQQTSVKVSDLEKEMARLLGEISTSRSS